MLGIIPELNRKLAELTTKFTAEINSNIIATEMTAGGYSIPAITISEVRINMLEGSNPQQIKLSPVEDSMKLMLPTSPLVRLAIPAEIFEQWGRDETYFKTSIVPLINKVQAEWEKKFGSYKTSRYGDHFFRVSSFEWPERDDYVYLDFTGNWASNKEKGE